MGFQPSLVLIILYCPMILTGAYVLTGDSSHNWMVMAFASFVAVLHAPAVYRIAEGKTVSIPWYYYTVEKEHSSYFKCFSIFLLLFPVYLPLTVGLFFRP